MVDINYIACNLSVLLAHVGVAVVYIRYRHVACSFTAQWGNETHSHDRTAQISPGAIF